LGAGDTQAAEESFRVALDIDPRLAVAWNGLGAVYATTSRDEDAIAVWKKAIEVDPHQYDTLYNLGMRLMRMKRNEEALFYLESFLQTAPPNQYRSDFPEVRSAIVELRSR
jgi:Tfp pilus assembly protein PilF